MIQKIDLIQKAFLLFNTAVDFINCTSARIEDFNNSLSQKNENVSNTPKKIVEEELEILKMPNIVAVSKAHAPVDANEVVAFLKRGECYTMLLAYSKNKELLSMENNVIISIKAESISREIEKLFENHKIIILK